MKNFHVAFEDVGYIDADVSHVAMDINMALRLTAAAMSKKQFPKEVMVIASGYVTEDDHQQGTDKKVFVCITLEVLAKDEDAAENITPPTALLNMAADAMCQGLALEREGNWEVSIGSAEEVNDDTYGVSRPRGNALH